MTAWYRTMGVALLLTGLLICPVLAQKAGQPVARPADWSGVWKTTFGTLNLTQNGDQLTGTYPYRKGRLKGVVSGRVLRGRWYEGRADWDEYRGDFEFRLTPDGNHFIGRWGKGFGKPMRGRWVGRRIK
jgi:alkaline phosphatase D